MMTKPLFTCGLLIAALTSFAAVQDSKLGGKWATDAVYTVQGEGQDWPGETDRPFGASPDGVALIVELKVEQKKLTGQVIEFVRGAVTPIESASSDGVKVEFVVYKKVGSVQVGTTYRGEMVDDKTIVMQRFNPSGKNIDQKADGTSQALIFHPLREDRLPSRPPQRFPRQIAIESGK